MLFFVSTFLTDIQQISSCKICMGNGCEHGLSILMFGIQSTREQVDCPLVSSDKEANTDCLGDIDKTEIDL